MPWGLTPAHLVIILVIVLIVVGPGKLPDTGAAIGKALRGFKDAVDTGEVTQPATQQQAAVPVQAD
jgi:sec-independent protein translocase protein TatA